MSALSLTVNFHRPWRSFPNLAEPTKKKTKKATAPPPCLAAEPIDDGYESVRYDSTMVHTVSVHVCVKYDAVDVCYGCNDSTAASGSDERFKIIYTQISKQYCLTGIVSS